MACLMTLSYYQCVQAIANLSVDPRIAKAVAESGGINVLVKLTRSMNKFVAEEAAGGLWNLSVGEEHKVAKQSILIFDNILTSKFLTKFLFRVQLLRQVV